GAGDVVLAQADVAGSTPALGDLSEIFGIELDAGAAVVPSPSRLRVKAAKKIVKRKVTKKAVKKARNRKA
ncbi:MAG TPA: hypothetical protein VGH65_10145, partial [Verrucomicrobiaceae bacterium]